MGVGEGRLKRSGSPAGALGPVPPDPPVGGLPAHAQFRGDMSDRAGGSHAVYDQASAALGPGLLKRSYGPHMLVSITSDLWGNFHV